MRLAPNSGFTIGYSLSARNEAAPCHQGRSLSNLLQTHQVSPAVNYAAHKGPLKATRRSGPLSGSIRVPGDKSISHRALMFGALAVGETHISGLLESEDVLATAAAMRALGAEVRREDGRWVVSGRGVGGLTEPANVLDMGNSGTAARLLTGILASHPIFSVITGDASLRSRPMRRVIEPLKPCGAHFTARAGGLLPLAIEGTADAMPLSYRLPVASAQVKSAVLLAGLNARGLTEVEEPVSTRDHTENLLRHFGANVSIEQTGGGRAICLTGQPELHAADVTVPADPSSASFPLVAALLVPNSEIRLESVGLNPLRTGLLTTLQEMGATITIENQRLEGGEPVGDILVRHGSLSAVDVPPERAPTMIDEYPILAVAAAFARGTTRLFGLGELRVKESDRLTATARMLTENGVHADVSGDMLEIHGTPAPPRGGARIATGMDHRMAMSSLVFGLASEQPISVDDARFIDTSFPGFVLQMATLGASFEPV